MHLKVFTKCQMLCNAYDDMSGFSILNTRGVTAALWSMRATDGSKRPGREYGRWVSVFMSLWATATSCSTELLGYIFETFNKLTYCIITHVYVYWCLSQKSWVFHGIQGHTPGAAHAVQASKCPRNGATQRVFRQDQLLQVH